MNDIAEIKARLIPILQHLPRLSYEQREDAKEKTRKALLKNITAPNRADYADYAISKYPEVIVKNTAIMLVVLLFASVLPSAFHIFDVAYTASLGTHVNDAGETVKNSFSLIGVIIAVCTIASSEIATVGFAIARKVFFADNPVMKRLFIIPIGMALGIAYVGNWVAVAPKDTQLFPILLAVAPPTFVLFIAFLGETLIVEGLSARHEGERAYKAKLAEYEDAKKTVDSHDNFDEVFSQHLEPFYSELFTRQAGASARRQMIEALSDTDRYYLSMLWLNREIKAGDGRFVPIDMSQQETNSGRVVVSRARALVGSGDGGNIQSHIQIQSLQNESNLNKSNELNIESTQKRRSPKFEKAYNEVKSNADYMTMRVEDVAKAIGVSVGTAHAVIKTIREE